MTKTNSIKKALKLLAVCQDPKVRKSILTRAPDELIKKICNALLNVERGNVELAPKNKKIVAKHRKTIAKLTSLKYTLDKKRKFLTQKGGIFPIIPILLSTALSALGSILFK